MELLLNLFWLALVVAAFGTLARMRRACAPTPGAKDVKALLALSCILVLLFPIVSASDDLHPAQAVLEDATKRIQHGIVSVNLPLDHGFAALVPAGFVASAWSGLSPIGRLQSADIPAHTLDRGHHRDAGRSPPSLSL
jgi:hypothetical protein